MNERIKELAEQAGYKHPDAVGMCEDYAYFDHQKFAELIVRECAGIYDKIDNGNQHLGTENYLEALQKHFGVEE